MEDEDGWGWNLPSQSLIDMAPADEKFRPKARPTVKFRDIDKDLLRSFESDDGDNDNNDNDEAEAEGDLGGLAFNSNFIYAEFAIIPALHGDNVPYQFSNFVIPPTFNNTDFSTGWQQAFINMAHSLNPNAKSETTIGTKWASWSPSRAEMLFNRTDGAQPVPASSNANVQRLLPQQHSSPARK
ncbi:hypothetical protein EVG20_g3457 [Dentipellis fragilis]|uniref:Uncharacterized protein n=1 Tax=Dentipellis fragilis TaxID=205917 RepID=A0A4Y9Z2B7_9AGAM|nr:hypothetical protein EVG20_g3457 [Dentipellis fragilis]